MMLWAQCARRIHRYNAANASKKRCNYVAWQLAGDSKHIDSELVNNVYELGTVRLFLVTETDRTIIMFETVCVYLCMCRMSLLVRTPIICQPIMLLWNGMKCRDVDMHSFVPFLRTYVVTVTFTGSLHVIENISDLLWHIVVYCTCIYSI